MADVIASRFNSSSVRSLAALNTITISLVYLIAQLVGAGAVITLLLGIDYPVAVIAIGVLAAHAVGLRRQQGVDEREPSSSRISSGLACASCSCKNCSGSILESRSS